MKFNKYVKLITEIPKHSKINRMIYQAGIRASIEKINSKTINPMAGRIVNNLQLNSLYNKEVILCQ